MEPPCGAGCTKTPSVRGDTVVGSLLEILTSSTRRRALDLYHGIWRSKPLKADEYVICADEKTNIQARIRTHPTPAPRPGQPMRVQHEYEPDGALAYLAAWDVGRAKLFDRCEAKCGIEPFDRLVC